MEFILDELKQFTVKKVNDLTKKNQKYLLVLYLLGNYTKCYSLVYIENPETMSCDVNMKLVSYISPLTKLQITQFIPSFDIYEMEYNFNINKFIEIKNNVYNQINNNEIIYYYQNPKIYYMFSKFDYEHSHGNMSAHIKRRVK